MKTLLIFSFAVLVIAARSLSAEVAPASVFVHTPPASVDASQTEIVKLEVTGEEISRVRALIQGESGYRIASLEQNGQSFIASVSFEQLAELRYRFQYQMNDGSLHESQNYVIRKLATDESESELSAMQQSIDGLKSKVAQLQNTVQALRVADPKTLAKQRHVEMARAVVLLSKREREVAEAEQRLRDGTLDKAVQ